jgi:hypothetical protein
MEYSNPFDAALLPDGKEELVNHKCHSEPRSVFERGEESAVPFSPCEKQIPHPQTARVRDDKLRKGY